jgi:threonine synthase
LVEERSRVTGAPFDDALRYAAAHRSAFMWPWEEVPHSIAEGILDDETYDWVAVLRGMVATGGTTVIADEQTLDEANRLARETTGIRVSHTGSAGLAGLLQLARDGVIGNASRVGVLFTGVQR